MTRWTSARANAWGAARPWVCGFNFLPSTAVNFIEMWHRDTFDRATIERELGWAAEIGFNALRVNLHFLIWQNDRDGLLARLDRFMDIAARLGLDTVPCFFDDCGFGGAEPVYGPQPDPLPGVHNSRAVASPGRLAVMNPSLWPQFEQYVRDLTRQFRTDPRILFWDLYNEPGNRMIFSPEGARKHLPDITAQSLALMTDAFTWARAEDPVHPLTVGAWTTPSPGSDDPPYQTSVDQAALALSDIITFHAYWDRSHVSGIHRPPCRAGSPDDVHGMDGAPGRQPDRRSTDIVQGPKCRVLPMGIGQGPDTDLVELAGRARSCPRRHRQRRPMVSRSARSATAPHSTPPKRRPSMP